MERDPYAPGYLSNNQVQNQNDQNVNVRQSVTDYVDPVAASRISVSQTLGGSSVTDSKALNRISTSEGLGAFGAFAAARTGSMDKFND